MECASGRGLMSMGQSLHGMHLIRGTRSMQMRATGLAYLVLSTYSLGAAGQRPKHAHDGNLVIYFQPIQLIACIEGLLDIFWGWDGFS